MNCRELTTTVSSLNPRSAAAAWPPQQPPPFAVTFVYGGGFGDITIDALDAGGLIIATYYQSDPDVAPGT